MFVCLDVKRYLNQGLRDSGCVSVLLARPSLVLYPLAPWTDSGALTTEAEVRRLARGTYIGD